MLAASFSYSDAAGKPITHNGLPAKNDLLSFMRDRGLAIDPGATQDAGIIANMLAKLAPGANLIGSGEVRSSSNLTTISLNGGQWKSTIPLQTLSMSISPAAWFLGLVLIIYRQRNRRAKLAAALLTPPITTPPAQREGDDIGGWDITLDADAFGPQPPALQAPPSAPRAV